MAEAIRTGEPYQTILDPPPGQDRAMAEEHVRRDLLLKTALEILRDAGTKVPPGQVLEELRRRVALTPYELSLDKSGAPRYDRAVGFDTGFAATIGWVSKIGGWSITDAGIEALETYPDADDLWAEYGRRYRESTSVASRPCKR